MGGEGKQAFPSPSERLTSGAELRERADRIDDLERDLERKDDRIKELAARLDEQAAAIAELRENGPEEN